VLGSAERLVNLLGRFRPDLLHKYVENALVRACQISAPSLPSGAGHWHKAFTQNRKKWYTAGGFCESTRALTHIACHPARSLAPPYRDCRIACFEESAAEEFGKLFKSPTLILRAHQSCQCASRKYMHLSTQVRTNSGRPIFTACSEALLLRRHYSVKHQPLLRDNYRLSGIGCTRMFYSTLTPLRFFTSIEMLHALAIAPFKALA